MSFALSLLGVAIFLAISLLLLAAARWERSRTTTNRSFAAVAVDFSPVPVFILLFGLWSVVFSSLTEMPLKAGGFYALCVGALLAIPLAFLPPTWRGRALALVIGGVAFLALADTIYWRFFDSLMPVAATQSAGLANDVSESILATIRQRDLLLLGLIPAAIAFALWPRRRTPPLKRHVLEATIVAAVLGAAFLPSAFDIDGYLGHRFSWKVFGWDRAVKNVGVVQAHARDFARTYRERNFRKDYAKAEVAAFATELDAQRLPLTERKADPGYKSAANMNVLVVQIEALQAWTIGAKLDGKPITPVLNLAKKHGDYFGNIWDVTGGSPTSDCEYAVMNSQYPLAQGSVAFRRADNHFSALPIHVAAAGFTPVSGHANRPGMWNRGVVHPRWGFAESFWSDRYPSRPRYGWGLADHTFLKHSVKHLKTVEAPFFGFLLTLTSHHPYRYLPKRHRTFRKAKIHGDVRGYTSSIHYVDGAIEDLLRTLRREKMLKDTLLVLYGDHDSKLKFQRSTQKKLVRMVGMSEWEADQVSHRRWGTKKIPLFILRPEQSQRVLDELDGKLASAGENKATTRPAINGNAKENDVARGDQASSNIEINDDGASLKNDEGSNHAVVLGREVQTVGSQVDIGPTVLHYLGLPIPASYTGQPLTPEAEGFAARLDGSAVDANHIYDAKADVCFRHDGDEVPTLQCKAIRKKAEAVLQRSWAITLNDLAHRIDAVSMAPAR